MSGYEHEHEHGHFMPHSHSHRHQGEQPTEAHERSGMGPHHHTHAALTRRESLDVELVASVLTRWAEVLGNSPTMLPTADWFAAEYARLVAER